MARFHALKENSQTTIMIDSKDFHKGKKLFIKAIVATPFRTTVTAGPVDVVFPTTPFGEGICFGCKYVDKNACLKAHTFYIEPHHEHHEPDRHRSAFVEEVSTQNYTIFGVLGFILVSFVLVELVSFFADENTLMKARMSCIKEAASSSAKVQTQGFLYKIFAFFSYVRRNGFSHALSYAPNKTDQSVDTGITETNRHIHESKIKNAELVTCYSTYKKLESEHGEAAAQKLCNAALKNNLYIARATQAHIDDELIREPITIWNLLKHFHFYISLLAKTELNTPRSVKILTGLTVLLGEFFLTGLFFYAFSTLTAIVCGVSAALLMTVWKTMISFFLVKRYMTEDFSTAEAEAHEKSHLKRRVAGLIMAAIWTTGCIAGIVILSLGFTDAVVASWMEAFAAAAVMELIILPVLKMAFVLGFGAKLLSMTEQKSKMMESKAFVAAMDFGMNYL